MVTDKDGFYTMKGYERSASDELTSSMEDYLEMVCRMEEEGEPIRVSSLAASLHVRPSVRFHHGHGKGVRGGQIPAAQTSGAPGFFLYAQSYGG